MRVVLLLNSLAPGGTEQSTISLARHLQAEGVRTTVVTLREAPHDLGDEVVAAGVALVRLPAGTMARQIVALRRFLRDAAPDVLHTALFDADIVGRLASWRTGIAVVSSFVNTPYDPARLADPRISRWKLSVVRLVDALTAHLFVDTFHAVSDGAANANARALRIPLDRVVVAERGRDLPDNGMPVASAVESVHAELGVSEQQRILLNVGRQEHQKAQVELLRTLPLLQRAGLDVVLLVAGRRGNATASLEEAIGALGAASTRVRVLGHRSDIPRLLAAADVLVISSTFEGTAGVALEAMAAGTPVVSTAVEGVQGVLEHGSNALLVPVGDPESLAEAIAATLTDVDMVRRLTDRARQDWLARFTGAAAAQRMLRLYREVT